MSNPVLSKVYCVHCEFFVAREHLYMADGECYLHPPTVNVDSNGALFCYRPEVKQKDFCGIGVEKPRIN